MQRSNRLDSYRAQLDSLFNFSFAEPRPKTTRQEESTRILFTSDEKRALGMWMTTVLELHSEEFNHALKHCRIFSIGEMDAYLIKHYSHLKSIIRFYIIAALLDYDRVCNIQDTPQEIQKPCIFLNILIEQLTSRFFRESQWLHKISHLPVYFIFPVFDKFQIGYTTLNEIRQTLQSHFTDLKKLNKLKAPGEKQKKLVSLVQKKLACNLDGRDLKICQENFEEIMLRVNLITFQETFGSKQKISSSTRYLFIHSEIMKYKGIETERTRREMQGELERSRKEEEELDLLREDYQIKQSSQAMSRRQYKSQMDKPEWQSTAYKQKFLSTPYSTQLSRPNQRYESVSKHQKDTQSYLKRDQKYQKSDQKLVYSATSRKQNNFNYQNRIQGQILFKTMADTEKQRSKLGLRMLIMNQLKTIREQKKKNRLLLLQYI